MTENESSLFALQNLMNEFFAPTTNNDRKREIETILQNFSNQRNAWQQCIYFLYHSSNQYVSMYSLTSIETLITKQWHGLMWEEKAELRSTLYRFAVDHHQNVPLFISNKVIKLVVDIARQDWPHFYPDFFTNILNLITNESTKPLGLVFLQTASEELAFPWEDLSVSRKDELRRLLLAYVPQVFELLTNILDKTYKEYNKQRVTATPPPSPTHGQPSSTSHNIHSGSLLSSMLATGRNNSDRPSHNICCLTIKALTHLFSWVPVTHIPLGLISSIFQIAGQGWNRPQVDGLTSDGLGCIALGAINELLYRNCIPVSHEDFLLALAHHSSDLLRTPGLEGAEDSYHEKLTECVRLIINLHWRRLEANQKFPALEFLSLVFNYTFNVCTNISHLSSCLEIWNTLAEHIQNSKVAFRYEEAIRSVAVQLSRRMQFRHNSVQLELLDNESIDDDGLTEWQRFLQLSIETLARLADLQPRAILCHVWEPWTNAMPQYLNSQNTEDDQNHRESLRDLSTFTQALGCFNIHFVGESFEAELVNGKEIMRQLVGLAVHSSNVHRGVRTRSNDAIEVAAQSLAASKAWCEWLGLLAQPGLKDLCNELVFALVMAAVPLVVEPFIPARLSHSAAHLLVSITAVVRPPIWNSARVAPMLSVHNFTHLKAETKQLVYRAACNSLMLPSPLVSDQQWEARHKLLTSIVQNSWPNQETGQGNASLTSSLAILSDMVANMSNETSQVKKMLFGVLQPRINETINGFPMCISDAKLSEAILDFFIVVFSGLQHHMGPAFTEHIVQTILDSFSREHLAQALQDGGGANAVEKFLQLLQLVMEEPGAAFKRFVPSTIAICLEYIYPLVAESPTPAVKPALFSVLDSILLNKWQYFYRGSVLRTPGLPEEPNHIEQLTAILQAYGQSLLQPDINLFGQNLRSLEKLNAKWKLYHKTVFREKLMEGFLSVLIQTLIHKSHALLDEDISTAIYHMASVDINAFHELFLTRFLQSTDALDNSQRESLRNNFKRDTDQPSFMQNIQRLVNDLRCYRLCNLSLPQGSFSLT